MERELFRGVIKLIEHLINHLGFRACVLFFSAGVKIEEGRVFINGFLRKIILPGFLVINPKRRRHGSGCSEGFGMFHGYIKRAQAAERGSADRGVKRVGVDVVVLADIRNNGVVHKFRKLIGELLSPARAFSGCKLSDIGNHLVVARKSGLVVILTYGVDLNDDSLVPGLRGHGSDLLGFVKRLIYRVFLRYRRIFLRYLHKIRVLSVQHIDRCVLFVGISVVIIGDPDVNIFFVAAKVEFRFGRIIFIGRVATLGIWHDRLLGFEPAAYALIERKFIGGNAVVGDISHIKFARIAIAGIGKGLVVLSVFFHFDLGRFIIHAVKKGSNNFLVFGNVPEIKRVHVFIVAKAASRKQRRSGSKCENQ